MGFNHLHVHSHYSIGRALPSVESLVDRAAALGMEALALTDNNSIAGMGELYRHCEQKGVQPILGCELDILPSNHGLYQGRTHRLVVLVENDTGYRNLVQLLSRAHDRPEGVHPHVTFTDFERFSEGFIVLSGSRRSELYHWLREKHLEETKNYLTRLIGQVGKENLFFEVLEYPHPRTRKIMDQILELSRYFDIPAVASQNVHFLDPEHMMAYCALVQHPHLLAPQWPPPESEFPTRHFTTLQEMERRFSYHPELLEATEYIAGRCEFRFPRRRDRVPTPVFERGQDTAAALWDRAIRGAGNRYGGVSQSVRDRISEEYSDFVNSNGGGADLAGFLLLLSELREYLRDSGVCQGVGRGKLLTSVVAYSIGLTDVDPFEHDLPYQSLRPADALLPLVELDVSSRAMESALSWFKEHVGKGHVVGVGHRVDWDRQPHFHQLLKWANLPLSSLRSYSAPAPIEPFVAVEEVVEEEDIPMWRERFPAAWDEEVEPAGGVDAGHAAWVEDPRIPRDVNIMTPEAMAEVAYTLHPCPRGFDMLRGQYAVSKEPVGWAVPVIPSPSGVEVTQADGEVLDQLAIPRVQFGSFSTLNVLEMTQNLIRQNDDGGFSLHAIPLSDEKAFKLLGHGLTNGVAALHNITAKSLLRSEAVDSVSGLLNVHIMARRRRHDPAPNGSLEERVDLQTGVLPSTMQSYWCAYLKAYYPVSFMAAILTHSLSVRSGRGGQRPRFQVLLREARRMGLTVLGPDLNYSGLYFSQEHDRIRTGLMVIQGLGEKIFGEIERERQAQPFSSLVDFCQRTDPRMVPQGVVVNLIKAGAFDSLDPDRPALLMAFERTLKNARLQGGAGESGADEQLQLFDSAMFEEESTPPPPDDDDSDVVVPRQKLLRFEQEAVGYSISFDLLDYYNSLMTAMGALLPHEMGRCRDGDEVYVAGFIDHVERDGLLVEEDGEVILDLEGFVVKVPAELSRRTGKLQRTRSPVLVEGEVQDHLGREKFLRARNLHLLEEVASRASSVREVHLDVSGQDGRRLSGLRSLLRRYRGDTVVRLAESDGGKAGWWRTRGIDGASVFFCPPLLNGLLELLPETRVRVFDNSGRRLPLNFVGK